MKKMSVKQTKRTKAKVRVKAKIKESLKLKSRIVRNLPKREEDQNLKVRVKLAVKLLYSLSNRNLISHLENIGKLPCIKRKNMNLEALIYSQSQLNSTQK